MDAKCTCIDGKQTGQRILGYMQKQGLSVNGLARMLEVTPNAVRWDEGCEMWRGDINISPKK